MDDTEPQGPVDWKTLYDRSERNRVRSRRALTLSVAALVLVTVLMLAGFASYVQQRQIRDVLNAVNAGQTSNSCRAELAADNESATTQFFTAIIAQPPDRAAVSTAVARLNQIVDARKDPEPCRALAGLPASATASTPEPTLPTTTTTATTIPAAKPSGPVAATTNSTVAATARCKDGTLSYAASHAGACSGHHGVDAWLG